VTPSDGGPTVTARARVGTCGKSMGISTAMCAPWRRSLVPVRRPYCVLGRKVRAPATPTLAAAPFLSFPIDLPPLRGKWDGPWIHHPWSMGGWVALIEPGKFLRRGWAGALALALAARSLARALP